MGVIGSTGAAGVLGITRQLGVIERLSGDVVGQLSAGEYVFTKGKRDDVEFLQHADRVV